MAEPLRPDRFDPVCPSDLSPFRLRDKWTPLVLRCLEDGPRRFSEFRPALPAASAKAITKSLRLLVRDGMVTRTEHPGSPRRVEYQLTPLGHSLGEPFAAIRERTAEHWDELLDAREAGLREQAAAEF